MSKLKEEYKTYIQFIKPSDVRDAKFHGESQRSKAGVLKSVNVKVPPRFSESWFCNLLIPEHCILDMKPSKNAGHITWVELVYKTFKKNDLGELIPNDVKVRIKRNGKFETVILPIEELKMLHLEAVHRLPKKV